MHWHILGTGRIGTLAALYLQRAGMDVVSIRPGAAHTRRVTLDFAADSSSSRATLHLKVQPPEQTASVERLLVACKTPYTANAISRTALSRDVTVVRLQNGLGSLDGLLAPGQRLIQGVTNSAVMADGQGGLRVVAENDTTLGGGDRPAWFDALTAGWPALHWVDDIRPAQWRKLVVNAAINALTAIHDVPNGALLERDDLRADMFELTAQADRLLCRLDPHWPGHSHDAVAAVVRATAANTSSMRADVQAGNVTEIDAINGWLLRRAADVGIELPAHRRVTRQVRALTAA